VLLLLTHCCCCRHSALPFAFPFYYYLVHYFKISDNVMTAAGHHQLFDFKKPTEPCLTCYEVPPLPHAVPHSPVFALLLVFALLILPC
jgi:hypothetical protein